MSRFPSGQSGLVAYPARPDAILVAPSVLRRVLVTVMAVCLSCVAWSYPASPHAVLAEVDGLKVSWVHASPMRAFRISRTLLVFGVANVVKDHSVRDWAYEEFVESPVAEHGGSLAILAAVCEKMPVSGAGLGCRPRPAFVFSAPFKFAPNALCQGFPSAWHELTLHVDTDTTIWAPSGRGPAVAG